MGSKEEKTCKICGEEGMSDFSFLEDDITIRTPHYYCSACGAHLLRDKWYNYEEWYEYINSEENDGKQLQDQL